MISDRVAYDRQWRAKNPDKVKAKREKQRSKDPQAYLDYFRRRSKTLPSKAHGLTRAEVMECFALQGSKCAICSTTDKGKAQWHGDHDHATGVFRGVLCSRCNMALGLLKDDILVLLQAAAYLAKPR